MQFVDSHCHLNYSSFAWDLDAVVQRAREAAVGRIIVPGLNLESSRHAVTLANKYESVFAAVGVHPCDVDTFSDSQLNEFVDLLNNAKVVAVGEIGLDFYHQQDNKPIQYSILEKMITLAIENNKPVILHSRNAIGELIGFMEDLFRSLNEASITGVFHAFEGKIEDAIRIRQMGFSLGAGGPITYRNSTTKTEVFSKIGLENILLETDSPFLTPHPYRGKRNEPFRIPVIAEKLSELQNCSVEFIAETTTQNAKNLFFRKA